MLYILGGISDVLDGIVARHFGKETKFGANLDTAADIVFFVIVIIKVVKTMNIPVGITVWIVCIAIIKCMNIACGLVMHKLGTLLIIATCIMATIAAFQEGSYILKGKEIR